MDRRLRCGRALADLWRRLPPAPWMRGAVLRALNARFLVGAVGVVRDLDRRILLFRHTYRRGVAWGLPGGYVRAGELPSGALVREVAEESGLVVRCDALVGVVSWPGEAHIDVVYHATLVGGGFRPSAEVSAVRRVPPQAVGVLSPKDRHVLALAFQRGAPETR
ncbi:MAG: NUDIX hydrolase [Chloroflexi bacterium]|nr:NUDIX hydrolase [Chloroflexota bacterium]MBI4504013.1 NUDIX hydrolase [Chloroflexota bacterium]